MFPEWSKVYYFLVVQKFMNLLKLTFFSQSNDFSIS